MKQTGRTSAAPTSPRARARRSSLILLGAAATAVALVACTPTPGSGSSSGSPTAAEPEVSTVASGLQTPWSIVTVADGIRLVSERDTGRIVQLADGGSTRTVAEVPGSTHNGEGGLLGLGAQDDFLYAYTTTAQDNRVLRFPISTASGRAQLGEPDVILDGLPTASFHNGGRIAFGPDRLLYVTVGDAGRSTEAQDRNYLGGKILRIRPDGSIPADNPFPGSAVYSLGHRNPQGLAWDDSGTLWAAEFGQNAWDELNRIEPGDNYGWPVVEGIADDDRFVNPVQQWATSDASPSGIAVADDRIWVANLRGESLRSVPLSDPSTSQVLLEDQYGRLRDVAPDPDGGLLLLTSNTDGRGSPDADDDRVLHLRPGR